MNKLTAEKSIEIKAHVSKVWEVLITPAFIKQWDDVPEDFGEASLRQGSVMEWEGHARLTVVAFEPEKLLKMQLISPTWPEPVPQDIGYTFTLFEENSQTTLTVAAGDFSLLLDGHDYYDASVEFVDSAAQKIKELAE
ncbi:MAG: SRPBCC domain-containing protein [Anaerolineaceae bacterium]|nr:SRPBCC domain-containing protein [Anaerolineaceae bacterium]